MRSIQGLSERTRRIIFWTAVIIISLGLLAGWVGVTKNRMKSIKGEELKEELGIPHLEEQLKGFPKIEMPKIDEETLKKFEELLKEAEQQPAQ